jgi:hypothetical protein
MRAVNHGESASLRFGALLEEVRPATGGLAREDLAAEVAPVLPLLTELQAIERASGDYESFQFRECFAVLSLLGRRLALLDLTPTAAIQVVGIALRSVEGNDESPSEDFRERAIAAAVEGFVRGREERVQQDAEARATKPIKPLRIDEAAFALIVSGLHEPAALSGCVDALGRAMLNAGVDVAIVDLTQLGEPNQDRAAAVFAADEVAKMLGGVCIFTGLDSRWSAAASDARIALDAIHVAPSLAAAIAAAREVSGRASAGTDWSWRALLRRLRG